MSVKYSKSYLNKLEDLFSETEYILRYEKGNFKSGYCLVREDKVALINKFHPLERKISNLVDIIRQIEVNTESLSEKNRSLYQQLMQAEIKL